MINAIKFLGSDEIKGKVSHYAAQYNVPKELYLNYICDVCCAYPELAPDMNSGKKNNRLSAEQCVAAWVLRFINAYNERISKHTSKMPNTVPDAAVNVILGSGLPCLSPDETQKIVYAHRLAMSAENILGLLLEEFLFTKLSPYGWAMAWGETVRHVDFCSSDGKLLQIKNRSNSENSSSSKIRDGKPIEKWFRVNAYNGAYQWEKLENIVGKHIAGLSEEEFQNFITKTLRNNPSALAIEAINPWKN